MMIFADIFTEMALLLLLAAGLGALAVRLQQPFVAIFIAVGVLARPTLLGWVSPNHQVGLEITRLGQDSTVRV